MTEENPLTIAELGAYTNNSMNREGIKKLVDKVNNAGEVPEFIGENGITVEENVIKLSNDWIECENGINDIITYSEDCDFILEGTYFSNTFRYYLPLCEKITDVSGLNNRIIFREKTYGSYITAQISNYITAGVSESTGNPYITIHDLIYAFNQGTFGSLSNFQGAYGLDGTKVTSDNIDTYFTSTGTIKTLKPMLLVFKDGIFGIGEDSSSCYCMEGGWTRWKVTPTSIRTAILNGGTSFSGRPDVLGLKDQTYGITFSKAYRRYNSKIIPEETPEEVTP